jgi:hypothetical protein
MLEVGRRQRAEDYGRSKSRSTAPHPLASWSRGMASESMARPLTSCALTGFSLRHDGADVSNYGASRVAPCYVPTELRRLTPCIGSIPGILSPKGLYVKILRKNQNAKNLRRPQGKPVEAPRDGTTAFAYGQYPNSIHND